MEAYLDPAYEWTSALWGSQSTVPWWAWVAALAMIIWGILAPGMAAARQRAEERDRILSKQPQSVRQLFERSL
ncbi:hypothetical protein AB0M36_08930 [Actinoplanes sp. NPDC051346]|uniref:hypothetical protein n=1 Tax=Actinoplanes sp. NPDC051346 TaxID=3155048 RepID=UPI00342D9686